VPLPHCHLCPSLIAVAPLFIFPSSPDAEPHPASATRPATRAPASAMMLERGEDGASAAEVAAAEARVRAAREDAWLRRDECLKAVPPRLVSLSDKKKLNYLSFLGGSARITYGGDGGTLAGRRHFLPSPPADLANKFSL